jgi:hypothetical protein
MALSVIGAGWGRTGTLSLKAALERLGYDKCHHMIEVLRNPWQGDHWLAAARGQSVDWERLLEGYQATVDWPGCSFWREFSELYTAAKVVLTVRDPGDWFDSITNTTLRVIKNGMKNGQYITEGSGALGYEFVIKRGFGLITDDRGHAIKRFNDHVAEVKAGVDPDRLLIFDVREGWAPLCDFLGKPVPDDPFPRTNSQDEFDEIFFGDNV